MLTLLILAATVAIFAYIGRSVTPEEERRPISVREVARNFWKGVGIASAGSPVNQALDAFDNEAQSMSTGTHPADGKAAHSGRSRTRLIDF